MLSAIERVERAIQAIKQGKMIILTDRPDRENEGDLIIPAENITPDIMNFIIRHTSGIVCLSLTKEKLNQLHLPLMVSRQENSSARGTPFTISIDAKQGITTGVSALDRTITIQTVMKPDVQPEDLVKPGHIFPLQAREGGVLEREGHTEGAVDLARLAGYQPAAVLCEIMNPDGTMAQGEQLNAFAAEHHIEMLSIDDLITYRLAKENLITDEASTMLPLEDGNLFKMTVIKEKFSEHEHILLMKEKIDTSSPVLVRIHSSCMTGDLFSSSRCDCNQQLRYSLKRISQEGGLLIYLDQEGRGIGLLNKIKAYALQEKGLDTVEANKALGLPVDARKYYIAANILRNLNIHQVKLLTNNPHKIEDLKKYGIMQVEREPMPIIYHQNNLRYLLSKKEKLNQSIPIDFSDAKRSSS